MVGEEEEEEGGKALGKRDIEMRCDKVARRDEEREGKDGIIHTL